MTEAAKSANFWRHIQFIQSKLNEVGIGIRSGSRFDLMCRTCSNSTVPFNSKKFPIVLEALRDIQQLSFILLHLENLATNDDLKDRIRQLLKDQVIVSADVDHTEGRDQQTELYVYAMCKKGGLRPRFSEPDIVCTLKNGQNFGVAVKRCKKESRFLPNLKKGIDQICRQKLSGCVVADITLMRNPSNKPIDDCLVNGLIASELGNSSTKFIKHITPTLARATESTSVSGMIFLDHTTRLDDSGDWEIFSLEGVLILSRYNQRRRREFLSFRSSFLSGFPSKLDYYFKNGRFIRVNL
jgi:hypothetical protein